SRRRHTRFDCDWSSDVCSSDLARALVRRLYPLVARVVRSHRAPRTSEEDLCQMIFIKVFQKLSQFSGNVPLEHWVSRVAVNTCRSEERRVGKECSACWWWVQYK